MRRLSSYPGLCTPGVSTRTICPSGRVTIPRILKRVVWGLFETAAIFSPTSRLSRVDLPALGRPMKATWPARWLARLFVWFCDIRWNDNFFGRDDDDFTIFPGGDGIAEAFVHQQSVVNGKPEHSFDFFCMRSKVVVRQNGFRLILHDFVSK